jgi:hypothetical protein
MEGRRDNGQIHASWRSVPAALLLATDMVAIESLIRAEFVAKPGATQAEPRRISLCVSSDARQR